MATNSYFINGYNGYFRLNFHKLLMAIGGVILLMIIGGIILLMVIDGYFINDYWWLFY
jgi:hypothetical protein